MVEIASQGAPLQFSADAITDGASFHRGLPRPGGLASLFLHGVSVSGTVQASGFPLPYVLAGVSVFIGGVPAPILALANIPVENPLGMQQINFQVPFEAKSNVGRSALPGAIDVHRAAAPCPRDFHTERRLGRHPAQLGLQPGDPLPIRRPRAR
jgi:hypothetical protein